MRFKIYRQFGALNSGPVFDAVERGLRANGHEIVDQNEDIPIIWSVLWHGRMAGNQQIYQYCKMHNKPIMIVEVGNLKRGVTWRLSLNNINGQGSFNNANELDPARVKQFGIELQEPRLNRRQEILIACQHDKSLQWEGMPSMADWVEDVVTKLRKYTARPILVRPHPRSPFAFNSASVTMQQPTKIAGTYDGFDIGYDYYCVINHNSGPTIWSAINGTPVICDSSSLAFPVSDSIENICNLSLPDRTDWLLKLCHTEWTIDEISKGIPQQRLTKLLI
jgi:hypothetical protein